MIFKASYKEFIHCMDRQNDLVKSLKLRPNIVYRDENIAGVLKIYGGRPQHAFSDCSNKLNDVPLMNIACKIHDED